MLYFITFLLAAGLMWTYLSHTPKSAPSNQNISSGMISYGKETLDSLKGNGLVTLEGTMIKNLLEVNGSLKATNVTLGALTCNGHASLTDSVIRCKSEIHGFLNAQRAIFQKQLILSAQKAEFIDCDIGAIVVQEAPWTIGSQTIELKGKSIVRGTITFESGKGNVIISPQSHLLGKVIGGKITR